MWETFKKQFKNLYERGAFAIFVGNFLTKFVALFGSIFIVRLLSREDYGVLGYMENLYHYVYLFAGIGFTNVISRYVVKAENPEKKYAVFRWSIRSGTIANLIMTGLAVVFAISFEHPADFKQASHLLPILILALPVQWLGEAFLALKRAYFDNKTYVCFSLLQIVMVVSLRLGLSYTMHLEGTVWSWLIAYSILSLFLGLNIKRKNFPRFKEDKSLLDKIDKSQSFKYGIQYLLTNGVWTIFMLNDTLLLGQMTGNASLVADYKVAYAMPGNVSLISSSIGVFVAPYFVKYEEDKTWVRENYRKVFIGNFLFVLAVVLGLIIFGRYVIYILYGKEYLHVVPLMRLLLLASLINNGLRYMSAHILSNTGYVRYNLIISIVGVVLQLIMNYILVPLYGVYALAYTSIAVYAFLAISLFFVFRYIYKE
jgi:O-antigen/teichoic acid export membrane protein